MLRGLQDALDGNSSISIGESRSGKTQAPNALEFRGPLYVLVDASTYSTCLIAAVPYKTWKREYSSANRYHSCG